VNGTQPTEGTDKRIHRKVKRLIIHSFRSITMAQVVYRGVKYDTQERREQQKATQQKRWFNEIYRGIKHDKQVVVVGGN
jgi:hypothetical protein